MKYQVTLTQPAILHNYATLTVYDYNCIVIV